MARPFFVGIPTLLRYDCLEKCIDRIYAGTLVPLRVVVIDNGGKWDIPIRHYGRVHHVKPRSNLGVAGSWNMLHKLTQPDSLVLMNDDIFVAPNTLELLMQPRGPCIATAEGWACFRQDHEVWGEVGDYDENFFPAYFEDNDYDLRRKLAGMERAVLENECRCPEFEHVTSATINAMTEPARRELQARNNFLGTYYRRKWGGAPGSESFTTPFNGIPEGIDGSSWERTRMYRKYCLEHSDIVEHVPRLMALARQCKHVTEFGVAAGRSTVAMLNAQPLKMVSYDKRAPEIDIAPLVGNTNWVFHQKDTLAVEIEPTEMLFHDSLHTYEHVLADLNKHAGKVSKFIAVHDTMSFGAVGEDGKSPGVWQAVQDWVQANKEWRIKVHYTDSNGLVVMERV